MAQPSNRLTGERQTRTALDDHEKRLKQAENNDVIIGDGRRLFIRSPNGHFWNIEVSNIGAITATDVGTTL